jgi:excisionase family DNA binding protein
MSDRECLTMTVPEAGRYFLGLSKNASYDAAKRGDIPTIRVGRLLRVPVHLMHRKLERADTDGGAR